MHIGIYLGIETGWNRLLIKGISRFLGEHPHSILTPLPQLPGPKALANSGIQGLIVSLPPTQLQTLSRLRVPTVSLARHDDVPRVTELWSGYKEMTEQALTHLQERGCHRAAVLNTADPSWIFLHHKKRALLKGMDAFGMENLGSFQERQSGSWTLPKQLRNLTKWLNALPKPMGLICTDATHTIRALHCLQALRLNVPGDVFLLCVSADSVLLECSTPGISSVNFDHETKGYRAAELLAEQIREGIRPPGREYLPTKGIIPRDSTAFASPHDAQLERAINAMHEWEYALPALDDIASSSGMSRSTMARKLKQQTGHTPGEFLLRIRLERALEKLRQGSETLAEITDGCGYGLPSQLSREVKQKTGLTPGQYRTYWQSK